MTLVRGKHSLRFGTEWRINRAYNKQSAEPSGVYTFNATVTGNPQSTAGTGYAFASYMLGAVASARVDTVQGQSQANFALSGFVQDAWKMTKRLTLNLGARYDFQQYPYEQNNGWSNFDINATDPLGLKGAMVYADVNGQPRSPRASDPTNFAPRVGFAWDVLGNGQMSVRGGYGIFYPTIFESNFFGSTTGFASTVTNYSSPGGNTNYPAMYLKDGLPSPPSSRLALSSVRMACLVNR
jgi:outer membrane receptor protein involved in Fe transport